MKIKQLTKDQIMISIDRLTRFKKTELKYLRVFKELILHNLISPRFNKNDLDRMNYSDLAKYSEEILNYSIEKICGGNSKDYILNKKLYEYEMSVFENDENTEKLLQNKIDYYSCLKFIDENSPLNLRWLKELYNDKDIKKIRSIKNFRYPIELVILVEGATEEILLPEFSRLYGFDFLKEGIYLIPAGGKNNVVRIYYELCEILKLPIYVLLDKDGLLNAKDIENKLRPQDKIHIIDCGEFEDILSEELINRTLNFGLQNISDLDVNIKEEQGHRVKYLEEIFKNRGMHDFKKVDFSEMVRANINSINDLTPEIKDIIEEIKNLKSNY